MRQKTRTVVGVILVGGACFACGIFVGRDTYRTPRNEVNSWRLDVYAQYPEIKDAMHRWAAKDNITIDKAMAYRSIEVMHFPDRECVQFQIERNSVGGVPIYCYKLDTSGSVSRPTTQLIYEHSDVE